jgi:tetratricopeptide (TPR) repeat protein
MLLMPKRSKQHQVEDISINELKKHLPREWVYREKDRDYGIDGEIEIFDKDDYATGLVFLVQIKATDSEDKKRQRRVQLSNSAINYYKSLELPVLIIRYIDESKELYFKWAHEIDRYGSKEDTETYSFLMEEDEVWQDITPASLEKKLSEIRIFKNLDNVLPLTTYLNFTFTKICDVSPFKLKSYLRTTLEDKKSLIEVVHSKEDSFLTINVSEDTIFVNILGMTGCYLHFIAHSTYSKIDEVVGDIFVAVGIALIHANKSLNGIEIFETYVKVAPSLKYPNIVMPIIREYISLGKTSKILDLWKNVPSDHKDETLYIIFQIMMLFSEHDISMEYEQFLLSKIDENSELDDKTFLGIAHYNYANFLHNANREREALSYFRKALKFNPHYYKEDYIYKEIAGILFHLNRYCLSAKCYKIGINKKYDVKTLALYADALMMRGEYLLARRAFKRYFRASDDIDSEWLLKDIVLDYIMDISGIRSQHRLYEKAMDNDIFKKNDLSTLTQEKLVEVLYVDALSPLAWFNLGMIFFRRGDFKHAMMGYLISALMNPKDSEAWMNALKASFNGKQDHLYILIVQNAYARCEEEFLGLIHELIDEFTAKGANEQALLFSEVIEEIIDDVLKRKKKKSPVVRLFNGEYFKPYAEMIDNVE